MMKKKLPQQKRTGKLMRKMKHWKIKRKLK